MELLLVIAIAGVLASLALPNFSQFIGTQKIRGASYDLTAAIIFARSEAIKRNGGVDMVQTGGNWNKGWTITSGATTLGSQGAYSNLAITDSAALGTLTFSNDGRVATGTSFTINLSTPKADVVARCIKISPTGVPNSKKGIC